MGIRIPSHTAEREQLSSQRITSTLKDHILTQDCDYDYEIINDQLQEKSKIRQQNWKRDQSEANRIHTLLPDRLQKASALSREKRASTWLSTLPLTEHGFTLPKSAFHDALACMAWPQFACLPTAAAEPTLVWSTPYLVKKEDSNHPA